MRPSKLALLALIVCLATIASAQEPEFLPYEDHPSEDGLSGDDLYSRMLENRFSSFEQILSMRSGDSGGNFQEVQLRLRYLSYREPKKKRILSRTIAKYFAPSDVRHLGYLVINKRSGPDDQFVYRPSTRKVRRINVRGEAIAGTDFAFEDVVPQEFEDGAHFRLPDALVDGRETYVVAVVPRIETESEYAKFVLHLEKEHHVPVRTLYWDNKQTPIKRLDARWDSIQRYEDVDAGNPKEVWIATESKMQHLKLGSFTVLQSERLVAAPGLRDRDFSERELTRSH